MAPDVLEQAANHGEPHLTMAQLARIASDQEITWHAINELDALQDADRVVGSGKIELKHDISNLHLKALRTKDN